MKKTLYTLTACLLMAGASQAAVIVSYDFAGGSLAATTQQFGTASAATLGSAFSTATGATLALIGTGSITTDGLFYTAATGGADAAVSTNQVVFSFTVGGLAIGETLQIDSLQADYDGTGVGTNTYRLVSYLDAAAGANPTSSFRVAGQFDPVSSGTYLELLEAGSGADTQVAGPGAVFSNGQTFSVAFGVRENQAQDSAYDNLILNGTVIPEPTTIAMLLGGLGMLTMLRRRRG